MTRLFTNSLLSTFTFVYRIVCPSVSVFTIGVAMAVHLQTAHCRCDPAGRLRRLFDTGRFLAQEWLAGILCIGPARDY
jgi:hypothetical protein